MFCSKCGTKLEDGVKFCSNCGHGATAGSGGNNERLKAYAAIALNAIVVVMFFLPWFSVVGMALITEKSGVTLFNAFSVVSDANEMLGGKNSLIFIQAILALLFVIPILNFAGGVMLFIKHSKARLVSMTAAIVTFGLTAIVVVAIFIMNNHISSQTNGLIPSLLTVQFPAYVVMILGLAGVFLVRNIRNEKKEHRERMAGSRITNILPFLTFLPTIISQLTYPFCDTFIVSATVGEEAYRSVYVAGQIMFVWTLLANILGFAILQNLNLRYKDSPQKINSMLAILYAVFAIILTLLVKVLNKPFASMISGHQYTFELCIVYLRFASFGIIAVFAFNALSTISSRNGGNPIIPYYFVGLTVILNIALDWLLIRGVAWGINGAAIATVIAQIVSVAAYAVYVFMKKKKAAG